MAAWSACRELAMGGAGRVDGERAGIADIGDMVEEFQCADETLACRGAAGEFEPHQPAIAAAQIFLRALLVHASGQAGVNHF